MKTIEEFVSFVDELVGPGVDVDLVQTFGTMSLVRMSVYAYTGYMALDVGTDGTVLWWIDVAPPGVPPRSTGCEFASLRQLADHILATKPEGY